MATITIDLKTEGNCVAYLNYDKIISSLNIKIYVNSQEVNINRNAVTFSTSLKAISYQSKTGETHIVINTNLESIYNLFTIGSSQNNDCKNGYIKSITMKSSGPINKSLDSAFFSQNIQSIDFTGFDLSKVTSFNRMFDSCGFLVSVKFGNSTTTSLNNMKEMFYECVNLISVDLSNLDTSKVTTMEGMFRACNKLSNLNIKNFKVTNAENFDLMFRECNSLTSLDLSNFITSKATSMNGMFSYCESLQYLNISNFDTSKVINMHYMFYGCPITSLDLSNFDISSVVDMGMMFKDCNYLISLNLNHFNGINVENIQYMFNGCLNLKILKIENFKTYKVTNMNGMFYLCKSLKSLNLKNFNTSLTTDMGQMFFGCESLTYLNITNFDTKNINNMKQMFYNCKSLTTLNLSNFHISENTNYMNMFSGIAENIIYCVNDEFYERIKNDMDKKECAIRDNNCLIESFWNIDISKKIIYETGKCVDKCNMTEKYKYEYENKCYSICPQGTTSLFNNNNICEILDQSIFEKRDENRNNVNFVYKFCQSYEFLNNECSPSKYLSMIALIKNDISNGVLNDLLENVMNDNKIDICQKDEDNIKYQITSSFNQKNKKYDNLSIINLDEQCESELKRVYNINNNQTLIIFKYDYSKNDLLIPIVGYEFFHPITKEPLDLNICKNKNLKLNLINPVNTDYFDENKLYKHNPNDNYYKDKCNSFSNDKSVDTTIYDRKNVYNDKNLALCPDNCNFTNYNNMTKKVLCQCEPQYNSSLITLDKIINKKKLIHNFINIEKTTNIIIIKCIKNFLSLKGIQNNIGSYMIIIIILINIVLLIIFIIKGYKIFMNKIKKNIFQSKYINDTSNIFIENREQENLEENNKITIKFNSKNKYSKKEKKLGKKIRMINIQKNIKCIDKEIKFYDSEMNLFDYKDALKNDKRSYIEYYLSLIKTEHPLISIFFPNSDYNSISIKICLFSFSFALEFFTNSLFFTDDTMHKIYEDEGLFNFVYNLPIIIYSSVISAIISTLIKILAFSNDTILKIKKMKNKKKINKEFDKLKKNLTIKLSLFFIISFLLLGIFWLYIGCFCAVYINTQIYLIKDTIISFIISLILPFITFILPCIIRIKALNDPRKCIYNFSKFIQ